MHYLAAVKLSDENYFPCTVTLPWRWDLWQLLMLTLAMYV